MKYAAGLFLLLLQDPKPFIDPEGLWEYEVSSVPQKLERVKAEAGWVDASTLKGKFWGTKPVLPRFWVMKHADAPVLLASADASAIDLYRVCRGACGKPGIQPYEHYVHDDRIPLPLEKGKTWTFERTAEGCAVQTYAMRYKVVGLEKTAGVDAWKVEVTLANATESKRTFVDRDTYWVAEGAGVIKVDRPTDSFHVELLKFGRQPKK